MVTPQGIRAAGVLVDGERIRAIVDVDKISSDIPVQDFGDLAILPGLVDSHVHINEPGRTEWEGFYTATRAAAAGGYTTLVDMPLNCLPATTTVAALEAKRESARARQSRGLGDLGRSRLRIINQHIEQLAAAGVPGFKCFLIYPGIDGFTMVVKQQLAAALPHVADRVAAAGACGTGGADRRGYAGDCEMRTGGSTQTYLQSRPDEAELAGDSVADTALPGVSDFRCTLCICLLRWRLDDLRAARSEGLPDYGGDLSALSAFCGGGRLRMGRRCGSVRRRFVAARIAEILWRALGEGGHRFDR